MPRIRVRPRAVLLALAALLLTTGAQAQACNLAFSGGSGTVAQPFRIAGAADLVALRDSQNEACLAAAYELTGPIVLTGTTWSKGIGSNDYRFTGRFDGNLHTAPA